MGEKNMIGNTIFIDFWEYLDYSDVLKTIHNNTNIINIVFNFTSYLLINKEASQKIERFFDNLPDHIENINIIIVSPYVNGSLNKVILNNLPVCVKKIFISNKLVKVKKIPFDCNLIYLNTGKPNQIYDDFIMSIKPVN